MALANYKASNYAHWLLLVSINSITPTIVLQSWQGARFPSTYPQAVKIFQKDTDGNITKQEMVKVTNRSGDTFTVVRWAEAIPPTYTSNTPWTTTFDFDTTDGDIYFNLVYSFAVQNDINTELVRLETAKLDIADYISGALLFASSSTGTDAYQVTLADVSTYASVNWQEFRVEVDVDNTGAATLQINALGAKSITKRGWDALVSWDIVAGQIMVVVWNNNEDRFELVQSIDQRSAALTEWLIDADTYIAWEAITGWQSVFAEDMVTFASATQIQNIGDVTNNTRVDISTAYGSGVQGSLMKLSLKKFVSPSVNLNLRIETDSWGSPSGTLIDPAATAAITAASLTTSLADTSIYLRDTVDADNITFNFSGSTPDSLGYRLQASIHLQVMVVNKSSTCTATRCRVMTDLGVVLWTATFSWDVATFSSPVEIASGDYFRIELHNSGGAYTYHSRSGATFPQAGTNLSYISGSANAAYSSAAFNIDSIETSFLLTIPKWTLVHLVAFQGTYNSETVNGTNYYGVGLSQQRTNTRRTKLRNGSAWSAVTDVTATAAHGVAFVSTSSVTNVSGFRITLAKDCQITTVIKEASCTATRCRIFSAQWTVLATATFSGNNAVFNTFLLAWSYKIGCDNNGSNYNLRYNGTASYPYNTTYVNFTSAYNGGTAETEDIVSIGVNLQTSQYFAYNSSTSALFSSKLLALTNSIYAYKLPTDVPRLATETVAAWSNCVCTTFGINNQVSWLTALSDYFIQDTDWAIGATAWTIICAIWQAIDATNLFVGKYNYSFAPVASTVYRVYNDWIIFLNVNYSSSAPETVVYVDNTDWNTTVVARSLVSIAASANHVLAVLVKKWNFFQYTATWTVTSSFSAFYPIKN